jgi:hypothetical protein
MDCGKSEQLEALQLQAETGQLAGGSRDPLPALGSQR